MPHTSPPLQSSGTGGKLECLSEGSKETSNLWLQWDPKSTQHNHYKSQQEITILCTSCDSVYLEEVDYDSVAINHISPINALHLLKMTLQFFKGTLSQNTVVKGISNLNLITNSNPCKIKKCSS